MYFTLSTSEEQPIFCFSLVRNTNDVMMCCGDEIQMCSVSATGVKEGTPALDCGCFPTGRGKTVFDRFSALCCAAHVKTGDFRMDVISYNLLNNI
ncbi:Hypothetical predicted protein [Scomber scombrus]|uniref:Uncharacterized protein n=1 Tax=Scomber scombrus TaxID=13677 RepID=A0AAV1MT36_SCOSC